jgi:hypothetical protein
LWQTDSRASRQTIEGCLKAPNEQEEYTAAVSVFIIELIRAFSISSDLSLLSNLDQAH